MYYIKAISSISHQNSFGIDNISEQLNPIDSESEVIAPNYKEYIAGSALRRLSPVLRMGLTAAIDCQKKVEKEFDAISVGTSLGCLRDTEKFLNVINTTTSDFLPPTAFIQSTHNTIAGQISLGLKNHAYNMTHTQNNLSFEIALLDGIYCLKEGKNNVLVGAADEYIPFLEMLKPSVINEERPLTSGASFFVLTNEPAEIAVLDCKISFDQTAESLIESVLVENELNIESIALLLTDKDLTLGNYNGTSINYLDYSGLHYSASAFGLHIAHDKLLNSDAQHALIVNQLCSNKTAVTLIKKG